VLPVDAFAGLDDSEAAILLGDVMERVGCLEGVTAVHYGHMRALARAGRVGASATLPGVSIRRDHDALVWRVRGVESREEPRAVRLGVPGTVELNGWIVTAKTVRAGVDGGVPAAPAGGETVDRTREPRLRVTGPARPLTVRTPCPGDRVQPFGMRGRKKLSDVFIDRKVPQRERARLVVIECDGEILWVPGVVASERTRRCADGGNVIRLAAERVEAPA
jgi:tRNA(Ile)-lysidine synthetase-like protein